jgi:hypothetical protein
LIAALSMPGSARATRPIAAPPCTVSRPAQRARERAARSRVRNTVSRSSAATRISRARMIGSGESRPAVGIGVGRDDEPSGRRWSGRGTPPLIGPELAAGWLLDAVAIGPELAAGWLPDGAVPIGPELLDGMAA